MSEYPRHFTPDQADALLPRVQLLLVEARRALAEAERAEEHILDVQAKVLGNGHTPQQAHQNPRKTLDEARDALEEAIAAIEALGVVVKDVAQGLVDFPAWRDGHEIFLCWCDGEPRVAWWH